MTVFQKIMLVLLGMAVAVGIFCITVGIGCAVNGVTFGQQIANWFGSNSSTVEKVTEEIVETTAMIKPII